MHPKTTTVLLLATWLGGCADLTAPQTDRSKSGGALTVAAPSPAPAPTPAPAPAPPPTPAPNPADEERVTASHILVAYAGAKRANPDVKRSKDDAKKRATEAFAKASKGGDFAELAKEYSDGPSGPRGGTLGTFSRKQMVKPFADAAFALKPGQVSPVVETEFGFHVIKRTE